jgi:sulfur transfer protein SufE
MSAEAKAEADQRWAQWIAVGARRNRESQKRAATFATVIGCVLGLWLVKVLVLG